MLVFREGRQLDRYFLHGDSTALVRAEDYCLRVWSPRFFEHRVIYPEEGPGTGGCISSCRDLGRGMYLLGNDRVSCLLIGGKEPAGPWDPRDIFPSGGIRGEQLILLSGEPRTGIQGDQDSELDQEGPGGMRGQRGKDGPGGQRRQKAVRCTGPRGHPAHFLSASLSAAASAMICCWMFPGTTS